MTKTEEKKEKLEEKKEKVVKLSPGKELESIFKSYQRKFEKAGLFQTMVEDIKRIYAFEKSGIDFQPKEIPERKYNSLYEILFDYRKRWDFVLRKCKISEMIERVSLIIENLEKKGRI